MNYTCSQADKETAVILDTPARKEGAWVVQTGVVERTGNGFTLKSTQTITMDIAAVELDDGTKCAFAGTGATLAFDGKRLNYTCGKPDIGLIGEFSTKDPLWTVDKVILERKSAGFALRSTETVKIRAVIGAGPASAKTHLINRSIKADKLYPTLPMRV